MHHVLLPLARVSRYAILVLSCSLLPGAARCETPIRFREMLADTGIDYRNESGEPEKRFIELVQALRPTAAPRVPCGMFYIPRNGTSRPIAH